MIKKYIFSFILLLFVIILSSCNNSSTNKTNQIMTTTNNITTSNENQPTTTASNNVQSATSQITIPSTNITNTTTSEELNNENNAIVIYFSRTNNTEKIANYIIELTNTESYEILAKIPYTDDDIKYYTNCRADQEQNDPTARPEIGSEIIDLSTYDIIYLGYPIWHGQAPKIMYTFVESYDLTNKTIIPFCTSASSPIGSSATNLAKIEPNANWLAGKRFSATSTKNEVEEWLNSINI